MAKPLVVTNAYKKDLKKVSKHKNFKSQYFTEILNMISNNQPLPPSTKTHLMKASGEEYFGCWNSHIAPNIILLYKITPTVIYLIRIGSHSDLGITESLDIEN